MKRIEPSSRTATPRTVLSVKVVSCSGQLPPDPATHRLNWPERFETKRTREPSGVNWATGRKRRCAKNCSNGGRSVTR
jgi:hypothetical protein